jgi:K+-sensing histidine kinase KdpD
MMKDPQILPQANESKRFSIEKVEKYILALLVVGIATAVMFLIGRDILGEGVIALLYLAPISWVAARWGQGPGILAAVASFLAFDFLFIPPFFTFTVGSLEGWLLLGIFLIVAIVVVGRVQVGLRQARRREHEAIVMYELSNDLAVARTRETIAQALAAKVQQYYQARRVETVVQGGATPVLASIPSDVSIESKPDLIIPILSVKDLFGEVRIWEGKITLPTEQDRLLRNLTNQTGLALERAQLATDKNL